MGKINEIYDILENGIYNELSQGLHRVNSEEMGRALGMLKDSAIIAYYNKKTDALQFNREV